MCTDVDRNDKSRVCVPGSVEVIGRRQFEMYSRLIHTVDHVCGTLREGLDALDGFLAHTRLPVRRSTQRCSLSKTTKNRRVTGMEGRWGS